jgi:hypothetical protein
VAVSQPAAARQSRGHVTPACAGRVFKARVAQNRGLDLGTGVDHDIAGVVVHQPTGSGVRSSPRPAAARLFACSRWAITWSSISYAYFAVMPTTRRQWAVACVGGRGRSA